MTEFPLTQMMSSLGISEDILNEILERAIKETNKKEMSHQKAEHEMQIETALKTSLDTSEDVSSDIGVGLECIIKETNKKENVHYSYRAELEIQIEDHLTVFQTSIDTSEDVSSNIIVELETLQTPSQISEDDSSEVIVCSEDIGEENHAQKTTGQLHLGLLQSLISLCLKRSHAVFLTIFMAFILSLSDTGSDMALASFLWHSGYITEAYLIIVTDYLSVILSLIHFFMTSLKSQMSFKVLMIEAVVFVVLNPLMPAICFFLWLVFRMSGNTKAAVHHHFLAKTMAGINGTFEAPMQIILVAWFLITGRIKLPWQDKKTICDSLGNCFHLGVWLAVFSYIFSWISLLKNVLDIYQVSDILGLASFILPNLLFRISCYTLSSSYMRESIIVITLLVIISINFAVGYFYRRSGSGINLVSSSICSLFCVVTLPEDPSAKEKKGSTDMNPALMKTISLLLTSIGLPILFLVSWITFFISTQVLFPGVRTDPDILFTFKQYWFLMSFGVTGLFYVSIISCIWFYLTFNKSNEITVWIRSHKIKIPKWLKIFGDITILILTLGLLLLSVFSFPSGPSAVMLTLETGSGALNITYGYTYQNISDNQECYMDKGTRWTCGQSSLRKVENHHDLNNTVKEIVYISDILVDIRKTNRTNLHVYNMNSPYLITKLNSAQCVSCLSNSLQCKKIESSYTKCENICTEYPLKNAAIKQIKIRSAKYYTSMRRLETTISPPYSTGDSVEIEMYCYQTQDNKYESKKTSMICKGNNVWETPNCVKEGKYPCSDGYRCVPYDQCHNNEIITNGGGLIDPRGLSQRCEKGSNQNTSYLEDKEGQCKGFLEVCCFMRKTNKVKTISDGTKKNNTRMDPALKPRNPAHSCGQRPMGIWPHVCAVLGPKPMKLYQCVGSLISPGVILTAASCVSHDVDPADMVVQCGMNDSQHVEDPPKQEIQVDNVQIHPCFDCSNHHNDVALLFLKSNFTNSWHISPVCMPDPGTEWPGEQFCFGHGWGKDEFGSAGWYSYILKELVLPLVENQECQNLLRSTRLGNVFELDKSFMCAGGQENKDTCQGDGGAPLTCKGPDGSWVQAGIVSWGIGCGDSGIPGVYASVAKAACWIDSKIRCYHGGDNTSSVFGYSESQCPSKGCDQEWSEVLCPNMFKLLF